MQHVRRTCAQALIIGHRVFESQFSLNTAAVPRVLPKRRHASSSTGTPHGSNTILDEAGAEAEKEESTLSKAAADGKWIQRANSDFAIELEKLLGPRPSQEPSVTLDSSAFPDPIPSHRPTSIRHARRRALRPKSSRVAEELASNLFGRAEQTQSVPTAPLALPPPPEVPEAPRPVLTSKQVKTYLKPLYDRGWFVSSARDFRDPAQRGLTKIAEFKTEQLAREFMIQVIRACQEASFTSRYTVTQRGNFVTFTTHSPETPVNSRRLTVADVAAAFVAEHMWELQARLGSLVRDDIAPQGRRAMRPLTMAPGQSIKVAASNPPPLSTEPSGAQDKKDASAHKHEDKRVRCFRCRGLHHIRDCPEKESTVTCLACKGLHHVNDCPRRADFKPPNPCPSCGSGDHWLIDCPGDVSYFPVAEDGRTQLLRRKCYICGKRGHPARDCPTRAQRKPPKACPVCGQEGHWLYDCPELPNRRDFVIKDCSYCGGAHYLSQCHRARHARESRHGLKTAQGS